MFGVDEVFVERSLEEMEEDMLKLQRESERQKKEAAELLRRSDELRSRSVDLRSADPEAAEEMWQETSSTGSRSTIRSRPWWTGRTRSGRGRSGLEGPRPLWRPPSVSAPLVLEGDPLLGLEGPGEGLVRFNLLVEV